MTTTPMPIKTCLNCDVHALTLTKHLCSACYDYQRRHGGAARPVPGKEAVPEPTRADMPVLHVCAHTTVIRTMDRMFPYRCLQCETRLTTGSLPEDVHISDANATPPYDEYPESGTMVIIHDQDNAAATAAEDAYEAAIHAHAEALYQAEVRAEAEAQSEELPGETVPHKTDSTSQEAITASPAFLAKVQFALDLLAEGAEAVSAALRKGTLSVRLPSQRQPTTAAQPRQAGAGRGGSILAQIPVDVQASMRACRDRGLSYVQIDLQHGYVDAVKTRGRMSWHVCHATPRGDA